MPTHTGSLRLPLGNQMRLFVFFFTACFLYETIGVIVFGLPGLHTLLGK
jgi:hypothetical protein